VYTYYACGTKLSQILPQPACKTPFFRALGIDVVVWEWIKSVLSNPEVLEQELRVQQATWSEQIAVLRDQLDSIGGQIRANEAQQKRLLDLYLGEKVSMATWEERNDALQASQRLLTEEHTQIKSRLTQMGYITDDQIQGLHQFAQHTLERVNVAGETYEVKRSVIDMLKIRDAQYRAGWSAICASTLRIWA
jgi:hypothetical protein